jgi:superfamily I DNA/RNA helicase
VVELANQLISHNRNRDSRRLEPHPSKDEGTARIIQWQSREAELVGVADLVAEYLTGEGNIPSDILILTPRRQYGYQIRNELLSRDIPTHSFFPEQLIDTPLAQERFALLTLLARPDDRVALRCWLGFGRSDRGAGPYEKVRICCEEDGVDVRTAIATACNGRCARQHTQYLQQRLARLEAEQEAMGPLEGVELINAVFPDRPELADVRTLSLRAAASREQPFNAESLYQYLQTHLIQPEPIPAGDYVRVMSLHGAKGLDSRVVIVVGCVEGWLPSLSAGVTEQEEQKGLEEQRRLFYVAITRPTHMLILSSFVSLPIEEAYTTQVRFERIGRRAAVIASRFLGELGPAAPRAEAL